MKLFSSKSKKDLPDIDGKKKRSSREKTKKESPSREKIKKERPSREKIGKERTSREKIKKERSAKKESGRDSGSKQFPLNRKQVLYGLLIITGVVLVTIALRIVLGEVVEDAAARTEYNQLRESFPEIAGEQIPVSEENEEEPDDMEELRPLSLDELAAINRDFIGWINANNNLIDYPVVRGSDNSRYINTTFFGSRNSAGTIFMDYRNSNGFDEQVAILYGHFTRDGSMFSSLLSFLNEGHRRSNPNITITTRDGRTLTYRVFAARLTDAWDEAYAVGLHESARASEVFPNAPAGANRFLLLSTCTRSPNEDERILVFAALS